MSKSNKNGQTKKRGSGHTLHLALPAKVLNHIRRMAKSEKRSMHFKACELMENAVYGALGLQERKKYEAAGTNRQ